MDIIQNIILNVYSTSVFTQKVSGYLRLFITALFSPKAKLAARLLAEESQLAVYDHRISQKKEPRPCFSPAFRFLWVLLSRYWNGWRSAAHLMQPATVLKWHRQGFRLYWRWRSRKRGRPKVETETRKLIKQLSTENRLWSAERIHDHLVLLGFDPPHPDTIRKYMVKPDPSRSSSQTWLTFIRNHRFLFRDNDGIYGNGVSS